MATKLTVSSMGASIIGSYEDIRAWGNSTNNFTFSFSDSLADGTAADQADKVYLLDSTIAASGTLSLDLAGSLTDLYGNTITLARVKAFYFSLLSTTSASSVTIGNSGANSFLGWFGAAAHTLTVRNNGAFFVCCADATAYPVTAGTADILLLTNNDATNVATFRLAIVGASA